VRCIEEFGVDGRTFAEIVASGDQESLIEMGVTSALQRAKTFAEWKASVTSAQQGRAPPGARAMSTTPGGPGARHQGKLAHAPHEREAAEIFRSLDRDGSGGLSTFEIGCRLSDFGFSDEEVMALFAGLDLDSNGVIDIEEFVAGYPALQQAAAGKAQAQAQVQAQPQAGAGRSASPSRLQARVRQSPVADAQLLEKVKDCVYRKWASTRDAFRHIDTDGSGSIDRGELISALQLHFALSAEEVAPLLDCFDRDGDGRVSYTEFCATVEGGTVALPAYSGGGGGYAGAHGQNPTAQDSRVQTMSTTASDIGQTSADAKYWGTDYHTDIEAVHDRLRQKIYETYQTMREAFLALDKDRSGIHSIHGSSPQCKLLWPIHIPYIRTRCQVRWTLQSSATYLSGTRSSWHRRRWRR
jgi:Ca2+-binding EF-hand superfamily protein